MAQCDSEMEFVAVECDVGDGQVSLEIDLVNMCQRWMDDIGRRLMIDIGWRLVVDMCRR